MAEITICSVFHSEDSKKLLELNFNLAKKLNPNSDYEWVVADNTSKISPPYLPADATRQALQAGEGGVPREESRGVGVKIIPGIPKAPDNIPDWIKPSFHHNIAMNMSVSHIKTRFALFLDSDFYILQKDWIKRAIEHMQKNNLAFLGTPWHPKTYRVFRYFPCHQCLFVDFEKLKEAGFSAEDLDFTPLEYGDAPQKPPAKRFGKFSRILNIFNFKERRMIGQEKHTAHRLFEKFSGNRNIKFEVIPAVFKPQRESYPAINLIYALNKFFEFFLPDKLCYIPKDKSYYSAKRFKKLGFDAWGKGWEEYVWGDQPFGLHVRPIKQIKRGQSIEEILSMLKKCFLSFNINL
ncbi:MAG: hypothetical protein AAB556_02690 [Patescibacteria group bacterium]